MKSVRDEDADFQAEAEQIIKSCGSREAAIAFCMDQIESGNMRYAIIIWQIDRLRPALTQR